MGHDLRCSEYGTPQGYYRYYFSCINSHNFNTVIISEEGNPAVNLSHATSIDAISFRAVEPASFRVLPEYLAACVSISEN